MTGVSIWGLLILIFSAYAIVPTLITRIGLGVYKEGHTEHEIAFTFDDGPDPLYTPHLLDLLKKHGIKATFFVVGSKAEAFPELIGRMHREGHLIGIHNYKHFPNWLLSPRQVRRQLQRSVNAIEQLTGERPTYYRPPWGLLTFFDLLLRKQFQIVLWSVMVGDWSSKPGNEAIRTRLLKLIKAGSVIVLHDSGETFGADFDAPLHMLHALDEVLMDVCSKGYKCVRLDELLQLNSETAFTKLSFKKGLLITYWMQWERLFQKVFRMEQIDDSNKFLHLRIRKYQGRTLRLQDGEEIHRGDQIAELHLDNDLLLKMSLNARSPVQLAIQMLRATGQLLPKIATLFQTHPDYKNVKGLYGITIIYRGTKQLGFTVLDLPKGIFAFFTMLYLRLLLVVLHPAGKERFRNKSDVLIPKIIAMSSKELVQRYNPGTKSKLLNHGSQL